MSKPDKSIKKDTELKFSTSIMQTTEAMSVKQPSKKLKKAVKKASKKLTKAVIKDLKKSYLYTLKILRLRCFNKDLMLWTETH